MIRRMSSLPARVCLWSVVERRPRSAQHDASSALLVRSWCGRQHKLVGTEIIVSSPMQPKPPDRIRMCVLLLRVHIVRLYYITARGGAAPTTTDPPAAFKRTPAAR